MNDFRLEMLDVSKAFPGVQALQDVSIKVRPGTVHALMGENGAGKSTLMKCLFGIYTMDTGSIKLDGQNIAINNPLDALNKGIAMVHQELQPIPERSIAENIFCGRYPMTGAGPLKWIDNTGMEKEAQYWLDEVHLDVKAGTKLGTLSISQKQIVEIAKAVSMNAKVLILDEPTSSLTETEVEVLFRIISELRTKGVAIIYISHKMEEILQISDDVSIMRDGESVGTWPAKELTIDTIISRMVGRNLENVYPPKTNKPSEVVLSVNMLSSPLARSFKEVSFDLRRGEILGFAGLVGAQRTELMEAIFGIRSVASGDITYKNKPMRNANSRQAIKNGFGLITEDRRGSGIFGVLSVKENIAISSLDKFKKFGFVLDDNAISEMVDRSIEQLAIKTPGQKTFIKSLSGGNQQKVIIARWLASEPDILIMDEPTRGIDVGAKYEIYQIMINLANQGKSIIMISSELPEILGVADRVVVMAAGHLTGVLDTKEATQEDIMELATKFH